MSVMLYPYIFCVALVNGYVFLVCCVYLRMNCLVNQLAIFLDVVVMLLLYVMEVLSVDGGALLDRQCMIFQRMCVLYL